MIGAVVGIGVAVGGDLSTLLLVLSTSPKSTPRSEMLASITTIKHIPFAILLIVFPILFISF